MISSFFQVANFFFVLYYLFEQVKNNGKKQLHNTILITDNKRTELSVLILEDTVEINQFSSLSTGMNEMSSMARCL